MEAKHLIARLSPREKIALARRLLLAQGDADGQPVRVRAFVRWRDGAGRRPDTVRSYLQERLPAHMVPTEIESVEAWPRLPNGKIDRHALLRADALVPTNEPSGGAPKIPQHPRVVALMEIWQALLGRESVGVDDDFFALGGHSLLAMQLISRVQQVFAVEVPMHAFFEAPTIAKLAKAIEVQTLLRPAAARGPVDTGPREDGVI